MLALPEGGGRKKQQQPKKDTEEETAEIQKRQREETERARQRRRRPYLQRSSLRPKAKMAASQLASVKAPAKSSTSAY